MMIWVVRIQYPVMLVLLASISTCFAQENEVSKLEKQISRQIEIRRLFVPEEATSEILSELKTSGQQYLPIDRKDIERLLSSTKTKEPVHFRNAEFDLRFSEEGLLTGLGTLFVPDATSPISVEYTSNIFLTDAETTRPFGGSPLLGTRASGRSVFQSSQGGRFLVTATAVLDSGNSYSTLQFPAATNGVKVRISIPRSLQLLCKQNFGVVQMCKQKGQDIEIDQYLIDAIDGRVDVRVIDPKQEIRTISTHAELDFDSTSASITYRATLDSKTFFQTGLQINLPNGFSCSSVLINDKETAFQVIRPTLAGTSGIQVAVGQDKLPDSTFRITVRCTRELASTNTLVLGLFSILGTETGQFRISIPKSSSWEYKRIVSDGFFVQEGDNDRLSFSRTVAQSLMTLEVAKPQTIVETERLSVSAANGMIRSTQVIVGVSRNAVLSLNEGWEIKSIVDVKQDEFPLAINRRRADSGAILVLQNEENVIRIVAEKKVDPRMGYAVRDFLIVPVVARDAIVEFSNGFADYEIVRVSAESGLPKESAANGQIQIGFDSVEDCRFQFSTESSLFSAESEYRILVEVAETCVKVSYGISVQGGPGRRATVAGIAGVKQWTTSVIGQESGTLMSADEKRLLGLDVSLPFWILPSSKVQKDSIQFVADQIIPFGSEKTLTVPMPYSVAEMLPRGEIQVVGNEPGMQIEVEDLDEVPVKIEPDDARKFVISGMSPKFRIRKQNLGTSVETIWPVARRLIIRSSGRKHEEIRCVFQRGATLVGSGSDPKLNNDKNSNIETPAVNSFFQVSVSVNERLVEAWLSIGGTNFRGQDEAGTWKFRIPRSIVLQSKSTDVVLNLDYANVKKWVASIDNQATVMINGELLELEYQSIEVSRPYVSVHPDFSLSSSIGEGLVSLLWLPLQICDTATAKDLFGSYSDSISLQRTESMAMFVIRREFLISVGVCLFFMAVAFGVLAKRLRYVLISALVSIAFGMVLGGIPALVFCFLFWGSSFGVVIRELRFLCTFRRFVPAGVLFLICFGADLRGQETEKPLSKVVTPAGEKQVRYIVYPVDKDKKPIGIGYLPRDLYELATKDSIPQSPLFHSSSIQIDETNDRDVLQFSFSFDVTCFDGEIVLPYFFDEAIYLEDTISVNGRTVDFVPDLKNQRVRINVANSGRKKIDIDLYRQLTTENLRILLPTPGMVELINHSSVNLLAQGLGFSVDKKRTAREQKSLAQGVRTFVNQNRIIEFSVPQNAFAVSILETIEFSKAFERRQVELVNDSSSIYDLQLTVPNNYSLENTEDENLLFDPSTNTVTVLELSNHQAVGFVREANIFGVCRRRPIDIREVDVKSHLLRVTEGEGVNASPLTADSDDSTTKAELISKWNSIHKMTESEMEIGVTDESIFDAKLAIPPVRVSANQTAISGSSIQRHFMSTTSHRIDSEFNVSFATTLNSFSISLPPGFEKPIVELGNVQLPTYQISSQQFMVVTKELQAGAYRFVIGSKRKITSLERMISSIELDSANVITNHQIWLDRALQVNPSPLLISPVSRQIDGKFLLAGTLGFDEGMISLSNQRKRESDVFSIEDEIRFRNGRVLHLIQIKLKPNRATGLQIGMSLPYDATAIQMVTKSCVLNVERSDSLRVQQIWLSPEFQSSDQISVTFESGLSGNGVGLPSLIGQAPSEKSIVVPRRFSDDELIWNVSSAKPNGETMVCRLPAKQDFLKYEVEERIEPAPSIESAEHLFNDDDSILTSRLFLSPNGAKEIRLQIDSNQHLLSATLCGRFRHAIRLSNDEYKIELLDHRFCQTLELVIRVPKLGAREQMLRLPQVFDWPILNSYIQFRIDKKQHSELELQPASFDDVDSSRKIYFVQAVETFELNRSKLNESFWKTTLLQLSRIANVNFGSDKQPTLSRVKKILSVGSATQDTIPVDDRMKYEFSVDQPVWRVTNNRLLIRIDPPASSINYSWIIKVLAWTISLGWFGILLQRFFPKMVQPLFSFSLIASLWLFSVAWIILTPQSIFAWCLIILAFCLALFFVINAVEFVRARRRMRLSNEN